MLKILCLLCNLYCFVDVRYIKNVYPSIAHPLNAEMSEPLVVRGGYDMNIDLDYNECTNSTSNTNFLTKNDIYTSLADEDNVEIYLDGGSDSSDL